MKAIRLVAKRKVELVDIPKPEPDGIHVLVKISKCGICGSELHYMADDGDNAPWNGAILGHEYMGRVVDPGKSDFAVGQRVVVVPNRGCGVCDDCRRGYSNVCAVDSAPFGGMAEYTLVSPGNLVAVPDGVSDVEACMLEPIATPIYSVRKVGVTNCDKVLVIGSGIIGCTAMVAARQAGATHIVLSEPNKERAQGCLDRGECDAIVDPTVENAMELILAANGGQEYDAVFECSGTKAGVITAIMVVKAGRNIGLIGASPEPFDGIPLNLCVLKSVSLIANYAYLHADFMTGMEWAERKIIKLDNYGTNFINIDDVPQTFQDYYDHKVSAYKTIIDLEPENR